MNEFLVAILKYVKILLIVLIVISVILVIISKILDFIISISFYYGAMLSFIIAFLSVSGNTKISGNPYYVHTQSVTSNSILESARQNMRLRDSSFGFMIFMAIIGAMLMTISNILAKGGL